MPINTIATATIFQQQLDLVAQQSSLTGWMDANAGQVIYDGGKKIQIPKMALQGLGNYNPNSGYTRGKILLEYETREMTQDRGRDFLLDAMAVNETNFVVTASGVMGEFTRVQVVPEVDAYRLSSLISTAITLNENVVYGYTPTKGTVLEAVKTGIAKLRDNGYSGELVIHMTSTAKLQLELEMAGALSTTTFSISGVDTTVPSIDSCPIITTPQNRMYSAITLLDGESEGQEKGGYVKGTTALEANFVIVARQVPIAVNKQNKMRIFDPETTQDANAWKMDYRRYHDLWVKDNAQNGIYVSIKDAKPNA